MNNQDIRYAIEHDKNHVIMFKDLIPNFDYIYAVSFVQFRSEKKDLFKKIIQHLGVEENENSFSLYLPRISCLNYYLQNSNLIQQEDKIKLQKLSKEIYNALIIKTYPDIESLSYPVIQPIIKGLLRGNYTQKQIETSLDNYITYKAAIKSIKEKMLDYQGILINNKLDLQEEFIIYEEPKKFAVSAEVALSLKFLDIILTFFNVDKKDYFQSQYVVPQKRNMENLIESVLTPTTNYWCLVYAKGSGDTVHTTDPLALVERHNYDRALLLTTQDFTKAYKGSWKEISDMVEHEGAYRAKQFLALYYENHTFKKYQVFSETLDPDLDKFKCTLDAKHNINQISSQIPEIAKPANINKNKIKL